MDAREILKRPLLTEKATIGRETANEYAFEVARSANKIEIKSAIEGLFKVKVTKVRTINMDGKVKRMGVHQGRRAAWKKAVVTLVEGQTLEIYEQ
ncbi:MAG: 50S ribosomal protein L23 [bacterium]